jgi:alanine racemase
MNPSPYPTWIEINLSAIEENTRLTAEWTRVPLMGVVKDDGYGHGAVEIARAILGAGVISLAVSRVGEGLALRRAGIGVPVLVLSGATPLEVDAAVAHDLTLPLLGRESAEQIAARATELGRTASVHLKVDTGMGRIGVFAGEVLALARHAQSLSGLEIDGIFSHFALAGDDADFTRLQLTRFREALSALHSGGINPRWVHMANTMAIIHERESFFNLVRAGGILYGQGMGPGPAPFTQKLRRGFTWKAQLLSCRLLPPGWGVGYNQDYHTSGEEWIGVVPVGYGDGYQRAPGTQVLIGGQRVPVVGRVCMDQFMVRLPKYYPPGSEVVLVGEQGNETILQEELQAIWHSSFSAVTVLHPRVPRIYVGEETYCRKFLGISPYPHTASKP